MTTKKQEVRKVPNLRFPEFEGEWEKKQLGEIAEFITSKMPSDSLSIDNYISTENMLQHFEGIMKASSVPSNVNVTSFKEGDILISNIRPYLKKIWRSTFDGGCSSDVLVFRRNELCLSEFLYHLLANDNFINYVMTAAKGLKMPRGDRQQIQQYSISLPPIFEQQKIATFLSVIDEHINKSIKIIEGLKCFKSAVSKKIFSQELRFKDDSGEDFAEWEEKKLGEVAEKRIKKNIDNKIINVFTNSAINGIVNQRDFFEKDIANQNNLNGYYIVENNDFVYNPRISSTAPVGPISRNHLGSGVMSPIYTVFRLKLGNVDFIECIFNTNVWHKHMENIANYGARADRMSFAIGDFYDMPIPFPSLSEQAKIANFLSSIDEKIETEEQILEQYKNQKAYLLQNMFI